MNWTYLDNNATTRVAPEARAAMESSLERGYGNPSSTHGPGSEARAALDAARDEVSLLIGCRADEIVFTSGGTESDNAAIRGVLALAPAKRHIITTAVEHPAVLETARDLAAEGCEVTRLGVDSLGRLDLDEIRAAFRPDTALLTLMMANNETGVIFPVAEAAAMARERGIPVHTDAVQAVGRIPVSVAELGVDLLSISGHKFHAPKGSGALYVRRKLPWRSLLRGGHQERDRRAGTENVPAIAGLGAAAALARRDPAGEVSRVAALRDTLERAILERVPGARVNGDREHRLPNTSHLAFEGLASQELLFHLNDRGLAASNGSACASGSLEPSHVLEAMRIPRAFARGALRLSLSRYTTEDEIARAVEIILESVAALRAASGSSRRR